jgi:hypothetical protein
LGVEGRSHTGRWKNPFYLNEKKIENMFVSYVQ